MVAPGSVSSLIALLLSIGHLHRSWLAEPPLTVADVEKVVSFYALTDAEVSPCRACRDDFSLLGAGALGGALAALGFLVAGRCRSIITITNQVVSGGGSAPLSVPVPSGTFDARDVRAPATPKRLAALGYEPS
jgi:hypothetical protein